MLTTKSCFKTYPIPLLIWKPIQYDVKLQTYSNLLQEWNIGTNTWIPAPWRKRSSLKGRKREGRREKTSNKRILSAPTLIGNEDFIATRVFKLNGAKTEIANPKCLGQMEKSRFYAFEKTN